MSQWKLAKAQERMALSQKERDRLKVLHEVEQGHLRQRQGAEQIGLSERGFRKLLKRFREQGDGALVHGLRGRCSNRGLEPETATKAVDAVKQHYGDFGPTLAAEYLLKDHGIDLSRETLRRILIREGVWKAKPKKMSEVHQWRERRSCRGELIQWDTSVHAWLEERGPDKMYLIGLIDDATSTLFARFVPADSTEHHMRVLWAYVERYGRPLGVYTDKASLFQPTLAPGWKQEEPGAKTETQLGRALRELGIEWIAAHSPQAKGRVERCFGTLQDRLVKGLRKAQCCTLEEANRYLEEEFLPMWNERFVVKPASDVDAHRPWRETLQLASILSHVEQRQVSNDYTVAWQGRTWQIPKQAVRPGLRRSTVRIEERLDGALYARLADQFAELTVCEKPAKTKAQRQRPARRFVPPPGKSQWMNGFSVKRNPAETACGSKEFTSPFPFPQGKPGRAGSPHAAQTAAPPTRGLPPLVHPPPGTERPGGF